VEVDQTVHEQLLERIDPAPPPGPEPQPGCRASHGQHPLRPRCDVHLARVSLLQTDAQQLEIVVDGDTLRAYGAR
jgi:hypothetical protein